MLAYHITDARYWKELQRDGFVGKRHSFTRKQDVTLYLSHPAFREFIDRPIVIEVEVPRSAIVKIVRDHLYAKKSAKEIITRAFVPQSMKKINIKKFR